MHYKNGNFNANPGFGFANEGKEHRITVKTLSTILRKNELSL